MKLLHLFVSSSILIVVQIFYAFVFFSEMIKNYFGLAFNNNLYQSYFLALHKLTLEQIMLLLVTGRPILQKLAEFKFTYSLLLYEV